MCGASTRTSDAMSAVPPSESVRYQQQCDRSTIPLRLVSFTFLLWAAPATFNDAGDATAGPPRDPGASASTTRQWCLGWVEGVIAAFRCRTRASRAPTLFDDWFVAKLVKGVFRG
jgi:hypothetical protein